MDKKKKITLAILSIISTVLLTVGVTYAVFTYSKTGDTENTITSGKLTFLYTENVGAGSGINITNAFPISDEAGKALVGDNQVFDFRIQGTVTGDATIPFEITLRKKANSTLSEDLVAVYLTDITEIEEDEILDVARYSDLGNASTLTSEELETISEKQLYAGVVPANTDYNRSFRLRMWIAATDIDGNEINQEELNGKTFAATVNVYANDAIVEHPQTRLASNVLFTSPQTECEDLDCALNELYDLIVNE